MGRLGIVPRQRRGRSHALGIFNRSFLEPELRHPFHRTYHRLVGDGVEEAMLLAVLAQAEVFNQGMCPAA